MKRSAFVTLLVLVVVLGAVIVGAFVGGIALGKEQGKKEASRQSQSQLSQLQSRLGQRGAQQGETQLSGTPEPSDGLQPGSRFQGQLPGQPGGLMTTGGTVGTVEKVEGDTVTLNTPQGAVRVIIVDSTAIQKMGAGSLEDISPGASITVSGERGDDGSIRAASVFITQGVRGQ